MWLIVVDSFSGAHADADADTPKKALINATFVCTHGGGTLSWSNLRVINYI